MNDQNQKSVQYGSSQIKIEISAPEPILAIVGVSGSGKSTLEANLLAEYPNVFRKMQQVTTRAMRPGESAGKPYTFIGKTCFEKIQKVLIGVLGVREGTFFRDQYGTLPDFQEGFISTIILAEEGLIDLKEKIGDERRIVTIGLDVEFHEIDPEARATRVGRDHDFLEKERRVLSHADRIWNSGNGKYLQPHEVMSYMFSEGLIRAL